LAEKLLKANFEGKEGSEEAKAKIMMDE